MSKGRYRRAAATWVLRGRSAAQRRGLEGFAAGARRICQKLKGQQPEGKDLGAYFDMSLQFVTACKTQRLRGQRMAEKTMVEKAGEAVGFGIAMAEDVAGVVKTAVGAAVTTVTGVLKKAPTKKTPVKQVAKKAHAKKAAKKAPAPKAVKKRVPKTAGKKSIAKKVTKNVAAKKMPARKAVRKAVKKTVKTAARRQKEL